MGLRIEPDGGGARWNPKTEDGNPNDNPTNPGGGGNKPPINGKVAAPGDDENSFKDGGPFPTFDDACSLPQGSLTDMKCIGPANDEVMNDYNFTQKWKGWDSWTGKYYTAYYSPDADMWAGGKLSSSNP